jgi:hypothetical protein
MGEQAFGRVENKGEVTAGQAVDGVRHCGGGDSGGASAGHSRPKKVQRIGREQCQAALYHTLRVTFHDLDGTTLND